MKTSTDLKTTNSQQNDFKFKSTKMFIWESNKPEVNLFIYKKEVRSHLQTSSCSHLQTSSYYFLYKNKLAIQLQNSASQLQI